MRGRFGLLALGGVLVAGLAVGVLRESAPDTARAGAMPTVVPASSGEPSFVEAGSDPRRLDLSLLVPQWGKLNHVWFVPAGRGKPQVIVAWQRGWLPADLERDPDHLHIGGSRRYTLTLWNPEGKRSWRTRWAPIP